MELELVLQTGRGWRVGDGRWPRSSTWVYDILLLNCCEIRPRALQRSRKYLAIDDTGYVGQPELAAGVRIGEGFVVQTHQGQDGGM